MDAGLARAGRRRAAELARELARARAVQVRARRVELRAPHEVDARGRIVAETQVQERALAEPHRLRGGRQCAVVRRERAGKVARRRERQPEAMLVGRRVARLCGMARDRSSMPFAGWRACTQARPRAA